MDERASAKRQRMSEKEAFYAGFDSMLHSDEEEDPGRTGSMTALQKGKARQIKSKQRNLPKKAISRSVSDTHILAKGEKLDEPSSTDGAQVLSANQSKKVPTLQKGKTFSGSSTELKPVAPTPKPSTKLSKPQPPPPSDTSKISRKRKRQGTVRLVAESDQVFRGLHFYFVPNNKDHPARKLRINKALEFGATWEESWCDAITHIIVDKSLDFEHILKHLKSERHLASDALPPRTILVNEDYPALCISWKAIVDPTNLQFRVKGYQGPAAGAAVDDIDKDIITSSTSSDVSLKLKPTGKSGRLRSSGTPGTEERRSPGPVVPNTVIKPSRIFVEDDDNITVASRSNAKDALDLLIEQAKAMPNLDTGEDLESDSRPSSSEGPNSEESGSEVDLAAKRKTKNSKVQDRFQCMQKHTGERADNPNNATINMLGDMAKYYEQMNDEWRIRAYRNAISQLCKTQKKICTKEEAMTLPRIGDRIAEKIEEIVTTNKLRRLDNARSEPVDKVLQTFLKIYGVGLNAARKFVDQGYKTLDELCAKADLSENQRIGIEHYEDFNVRIPRAEVAQHGRIVKVALQKIDRSFNVIIGGSYRRGAKKSGDIDCLITHPHHTQATIRAIVLDQLVPALTRANFLVAALAETSRQDGSKWHGASCLPSNPGEPQNPWRRIDLLLVPDAELGAALIYFTGNDIFNRSMRLLASRKGMRLNQRGLYEEVLRGKGRVKLTEGRLVEGRSEKKIFEILGVPWRPPEHRIPRRG